MTRRNVQFTKFQEQHPQFKDKWANDYFESVVCTKVPLLLQQGFFGSTVPEIRRIIKLKQPVEILCGNKELLERCRRHLPADIQPIVHLHPWYEDSIYVILTREEMAVTKKAA